MRGWIVSLVLVVVASELTLLGIGGSGGLSKEALEQFSKSIEQRLEKDKQLVESKIVEKGKNINQLNEANKLINQDLKSLQSAVDNLRHSADLNSSNIRVEFNEFTNNVSSAIAVTNSIFVKAVGEVNNSCSQLFSTISDQATALNNSLMSLQDRSNDNSNITQYIDNAIQQLNQSSTTQLHNAAQTYNQTLNATQAHLLDSIYNQSTLLTHKLDNISSHFAYNITNISFILNANNYSITSIINHTSTLNHSYYNLSSSLAALSDTVHSHSAAADLRWNLTTSHTNASLRELNLTWSERWLEYISAYNATITTLNMSLSAVNDTHVRHYLDLDNDVKRLANETSHQLTTLKDRQSDINNNITSAMLLQYNSLNSTLNHNNETATRFLHSLASLVNQSLVSISHHSNLNLLEHLSFNHSISLLNASIGHINASLAIERGHNYDRFDLLNRTYLALLDNSTTNIYNKLNDTQCYITDMLNKSAYNIHNNMSYMNTTLYNIIQQSHDSLYSNISAITNTTIPAAVDLLRSSLDSSLHQLRLNHSDHIHGIYDALQIQNSSLSHVNNTVHITLIPWFNTSLAEVNKTVPVQLEGLRWEMANETAAFWRGLESARSDMMAYTDAVVYNNISQLNISIHALNQSQSKNYDLLSRRLNDTRAAHNLRLDALALNFSTALTTLTDSGTRDLADAKQDILSALLLNSTEFLRLLSVYNESSTAQYTDITAMHDAHRKDTTSNFTQITLALDSLHVALNQSDLKHEEEKQQMRTNSSTFQQHVNHTLASYKGESVEYMRNMSTHTDHRIDKLELVHEHEYRALNKSIHDLSRDSDSIQAEVKQLTLDSKVQLAQWYLMQNTTSAFMNMYLNTTQQMYAV